MYKNTFIFSEDDYLMHYGVKRRSGRYPWGSGDNPYQHSGDFLSRVDVERHAVGLLNDRLNSRCLVA